MKTQMEQNNITHKQERQIELSLAPIEYTGKGTHYVVSVVSVSSLEKTFKSNNYSPIHWNSNYRHTKNFKKGVGFCLDIDETITIQKAGTILKQHNLNYALITTRNHKEEAHRFRIFIPFSCPIYNYPVYKKAAVALAKIFKDACDEAVFDGARQLYGSPENAYYSCSWNGQDFNVTPFLGEDLSIIKYGDGDWNDNLIVRLAKGGQVSIDKITIDENKGKTTPIFCPWHDDQSHSAFVSFSDKSWNWFIRCMSCEKMYWKTKIPPPNEERCKGYWSHAKGVYEVGLVGGEFIFKDIGEKKFYVKVSAYSLEVKEEVFQWIVENQHLSALRRVDLLGDGDATENIFTILKDEGIVEVRYAPLPVDKADNQFVEDYLETTFRGHKDFIKEYLAGYCFTNLRPLPTLILVGKRGTGKNTFAEAVAEIFKPLSTFWEVSKDVFNPAYEKKLLIADETLTDDKRNYTELKKISGQNEHPINKKYTPHYNVKNNINVIILSNRLLPIFVESSELPSMEELNQFFVYEFPKIAGPIDAEIGRKLKERLGYYIRTELKQVFSGMGMHKYRYGMKVPITDEERRLFNCSVSVEDDLKDRFIQQLTDRLENPIGWDFQDHITSGYLPKEVFEEFKYQDKEKRIIIRRLREIGYLSDDEPIRFQAKMKRTYCYQMKDPLKKKIEKDLGTGCFA
jgi:hypothetical protein